MLCDIELRLDMLNSTATMKAELKQWGVGHGGFHTVKVTNRSGEVTCRYIYDCGSRARKRRLAPAIDEYVDALITDGASVIDILYLSHFDQDHVNGIKHLANALDNASPKIRINRIVVPFLTPEQQLAAIASNNSFSRIFTNLVLNPEETLEDLFSEATVDILTPQQESETDGDVRYDAETSDGTLSPTSSGNTGLPSNRNVIWEVIAYVQPAVTQNAVLFWREVQRLGLTTRPKLNSATIRELVENHATTLRGLAIQLLKPNDGSNRSSIVLYSGPKSGLSAKSFVQKNDTRIPWKALPQAAKQWWKTDTTNYGGWLSTGDARLETSQSVNALTAGLGGKRIKRTMVIAAPHHGSKNNSGSDLWKTFTNAKFVTIHARYTIKRNPHHPHKSVTKAIEQQYGKYYIVSDSSDNVNMNCWIY